jgi:hypothetical protein
MSDSYRDPEDDQSTQSGGPGPDPAGRDSYMDSEDDLIRCWQSTQPVGPAPDPARLTRAMASTVASFDRKIFRRNAAEYLGCAFLLVWSGLDLWNGDKLAGISIGAVLFVMSYLWWNHRKQRVPDASADVRSYQAALLERFDRQIRLVSRVKYWYLLPLYVSVIVSASKTWLRRPAAALLGLAIVGAVFVFIWWLNEVAGVRRLQQARARVADMFEGGKDGVL